MNAFEIVTLVVSLVAIAIALTTYFRSSRAVQDLGRHGGNWFDHAEDMHVGDRPSEDERDVPIPKRPLRGRPD